MINIIYAGRSDGAGKKIPPDLGGIFLYHALVILAAAQTVRREEFLHREADTAEQSAGVIL